MQDKLVHLLSADLKHFERLFIEYAGSIHDQISFKTFREMVVSFRRFNRVIVNVCLEKILKRMSSQVEDDIFISFSEYVDYLELISLEQDKYLNEKDPEIRMLFDLLSLGEPVIYKRKIVEIIKEFELPISIDEFFQPIGKKEEINFNDFCYLFKATNEQGEMFFSTFTSSFYNLNM